jgi:hypothetical protein
LPTRRRVAETATLVWNQGWDDEGAVMARSPSPMSPEFALLAACALLDDGRLAETAPPLVLRPGFDWDRFVELGRFHGIEQVARARLDRTVPGAVPAEQAVRLQRWLVQGAALNAAHARMAVRVVGWLERAGIAALVLKGAALAGQLYAPDPDQRVSSDVDILVAPENLRAADRVLRQAGLARSWPPADPPEAARAMFMQLANVFDYRGPVNGELVELHCRATLNPHALPASFEELRAASVPAETGHGTVRTLGGPLLMLYLCHHALSQLPHRLKWFGDVARVLRLAGQTDCAAYVASYPGPLPLGAARLTGHVLAGFETAIAKAAGEPAAARGGPDFARIAAVMERGENVSVARTPARLPLELRQLAFVLRVTGGWRGKAYEILRALADPRDAVSLRLSPRFAVVYALAGPLLSLWRFARRGKAGPSGTG